MKTQKLLTILVLINLAFIYTLAKQSGKQFNNGNKTQRDGKKSIILLEFAMNPYDPLARATNRLWNKVLKPWFETSQPEESETLTTTTAKTIPITESITTRNTARPLQMTTFQTMGTTTKPGKITFKPTISSSTELPVKSSSSLASLISSITEITMTSQMTTAAPSSSHNSSITPSSVSTDPSSSPSSAIPTTDQLINCIDWLLGWLQSNSSLPLRAYKGLPDLSRL